MGEGAERVVFMKSESGLEARPLGLFPALRHQSLRHTLSLSSLFSAGKWRWVL